MTSCDKICHFTNLQKICTNYLNSLLFVFLTSNFRHINIVTWKVTSEMYVKAVKIDWMKLTKAKKKNICCKSFYKS